MDSLADEIKQVACGAFHTMAVTAEGVLFAWGKEEFGCLGIHLNREKLDSGVYRPLEVSVGIHSSGFTH